MSEPFDIMSEAVNETAFLHLKSAKGELLYNGETPVGITFYGPSSPAYAMVEGRQTARAVKRRNDADGKLSVASPEEARIEVADDLAAITVSFDGGLSYPPAGEAKGTQLFKAFYADPRFGFVIPQANKFIGDWGKFSAGSATG